MQGTCFWAVSTPTLCMSLLGQCQHSFLFFLQQAGGGGWQEMWDARGSCVLRDMELPLQIFQGVGRCYKHTA